MHELTILVGIVDMVEEQALKYNVKNIDSIVIEIGEVSDIVPRYMTEYYPNATSGSILEGSHLEVEIIKANGLCHHCNKVFSVVKNKGCCPICGADDYELLCGRELNLKEIRVIED